MGQSQWSRTDATDVLASASISNDFYKNIQRTWHIIRFAKLFQYRSNESNDAKVAAFNEDRAALGVY